MNKNIEEEKDDVWKEIEKINKFSTKEHIDKKGKVNYILQKSLLVDKRDDENKLVLSDDETQVEKEWKNRNITIYKGEIKDLLQVVTALDKWVFG